ncbi:MAG: metallophosphoesterase family protein [Thermomicrobiales bacterium]
MKIAILSDIHGNTLALDAVLADIAEEAPDGYWIVGDLVAPGPYPADAARMLSSLPNASFVRGNTDRKVLQGDFPDDPDRSDATRFVWVHGAIAATGYEPWLRAIPLEAQETLPDATRVLLVHAAPGTDDGRGIPPDMTDAELAGILHEVNADLVLVGHTHVPLDREVNVNGRTVHVHNPGSVSLPKTNDHRAMWTLLTANDSGYTLERRFAPYDIDRVKAAFDEVRHPAAEALKAMFP